VEVLITSPATMQTNLILYALYCPFSLLQMRGHMGEPWRSAYVPVEYNVGLGNTAQIFFLHIGNFTSPYSQYNMLSGGNIFLYAITTR